MVSCDKHASTVQWNINEKARPYITTAWPHPAMSTTSGQIYTGDNWGVQSQWIPDDGGQRWFPEQFLSTIWHG
jgi:hypothetical protein